MELGRIRGQSRSMQSEPARAEFDIELVTELFDSGPCISYEVRVNPAVIPASGSIILEKLFCRGS